MRPLNPFHMVYDNWINDTPLPNLAAIDEVLPNYLHTRYEFPFVTECPIEKYCEEHQYPLHKHKLDSSYPAPSFYPIGIDKFDIKIDYFALMTPQVHQHLIKGRLLAVFFIKDCHNAREIGALLESGTQKHGLPWNCYRVVMNNPMVDFHANWCFHFNFAELDYQRQNQCHVPLPLRDRSPQKDFTVLCRNHQPWRALVMTHLHKSGLLKNAHWSYGNLYHDRVMDWNPIDINKIPNLAQEDIDKFLIGTPYKADLVPLGQQQDSSILIDHHFLDSNVHVVIESTMEAQGGSVLSEKIFKPIKHGQPFVIIGTVDSLLQLKCMGYKTFDDIIDSGYDSLTDHTQRYLTVYRLLRDLKVQGTRQIYESCIDDIEHNRQIFMQSKQQSLATLVAKLICHFLWTNNDYGNYTHEEIFSPWNQK